jgi:ribonucleoside-diphosphate reductase alpha chain
MDPLQGKVFFVRKRDSRVEEFNEARIFLAIESAFKAVEGVGRDQKLAAPLQVHVKKCADVVVERVLSSAVRGGELEVERIQDVVENQLMLEGHLEVARRYILYREHRRQARAEREGRVISPSAVALPVDVAPPLSSFAKAAVSTAPAAAEEPGRTDAGAATALLQQIYSQALPGVSCVEALEQAHRGQFSVYINEGEYLKLLAPELMDFDLDLLAGALRLDRDQLFPATGLQALHDDYLLHENGRRIETPQYFWMRLAMGLALNEGEQCNAWALEFYEALSTFCFVPAETVLRHAGTIEPRLIPSYVSTSWNDLEHVSLQAGSATERQKRSSTCSWLEPWHLGIRDFLQRPGPGGFAGNHDVNKGLWVPDLFMKRVCQQGRWTLFDPAEAPDLHQQFGPVFEQHYLQYEHAADRGEIRNFQHISAADLWREILASLAQTGQPWIGFKDAANARSMQDHVGLVHSANLCTSLLLNGPPDEPAACSVGSINLAAHLSVDSAEPLNLPLLRRTVGTAMRMLDNAIDISSYPSKTAQAASQEHRPAALGLFGFQDAMNLLKIRKGSAAADFAGHSAEILSHCAILSSSSLAIERGRYPSYEGSKWSHGLLPMDTLVLLANERGFPIEVDSAATQDWDLVRKTVRRHGLRHCTVAGISPTEAGSRITGASLSVEPVGQLKAKRRVGAESGPQWLVECAARRQKWLDMSQALNLYSADLSPSLLADLYLQAWRKGVKTIRQLHSPSHLASQKPPSRTLLDKEKSHAGQTKPEPAAAK